jgi:hypothetical protein
MNMQKMRRASGALAALSGVVLLVAGLALQRVDAMVLGLAALVVVMAGLALGLRYRIATLSSQVQQLANEMHVQVRTQLGDFRRISNETTGLVLRSFRDMEMAHRAQAADLAEVRQVMASLSAALDDVSRGMDAASGRTSDALAAIPSQVTDVLQTSLSPAIETSERLMRQLIRQTDGLPPKVTEALRGAIAPDMQTSGKLMRQLIRQTDGLPPKVAEALRAAMAPDMETSGKLMRQLIRQTDGLPPRVTEALRAAMAPDMETSGKLMRQLIRQTDDLPPKLAEALQTASGPATETAERLMRQILRDVGKLPGEFASRIDDFAHSNEKLNALAYRALARIQHETLQEAEALLQLYRLFNLEAPMPLLGGAAKGWAMEPVTMLAVVDEVLARKPALVVECGSGTSTVWIAHALSRIGAGSLVSLEHLEHYARLGDAALDAHDLRQFAEIRRAPLEACRVGDETFNWYEASTLADLRDVTMLIVDGPPSSTGPLARYPALPLMWDRLAPGALVLIDDVGRDDEQRVVERWQQEYSALRNPRMISGRTMAFDYVPEQGSQALT